MFMQVQGIDLGKSNFHLIGHDRVSRIGALLLEFGVSLPSGLAS